MKKTQLQGILRKDLSNSATKAARNKGLVPTILYGFQKENISCLLPMIDLLPLLDSMAPSFIELDLEGKKYRCIINDVQYHPVSDIPLHIDLLHITDKRPIRLHIPLSFQGDAPGILQGGELAVKQRTLPIKALPANMPEKLLVDISSLGLGEKVTVSAISKGKYEILAQPQIPVAAIMIPRALRSKAAESEDA